MDLPQLARPSREPLLTLEQIFEELRNMLAVFFELNRSKSLMPGRNGDSEFDDPDKITCFNRLWTYAPIRSVFWLPFSSIRFTIQLSFDIFPIEISPAGIVLNADSRTFAE